MKTRWLYPAGVCQCGCGETAPIAKRGRSAGRFVKGHQTRLGRWGDPGAVGEDRVRMESVQRRFWVNALPWSDGCVEWTGTLRSDGYGVMGLGRKADGLIRVHRMAYMLLCGSIPDDLVVDHLCGWRRCVAPDCLELVTPEENVRRATLIQAPTCRRGHPRTSEYTYTDPRGWRECIVCRAQNVQRYRERAAA